MHDPHTLQGKLSTLDLLEVQVASIVRGPHLRLLTAMEIADLHRKIDDAEAMLREAAMQAGLDSDAPLAILRRQVRADAYVEACSAA